MTQNQRMVARSRHPVCALAAALAVLVASVALTAPSSGAPGTPVLTGTAAADVGTMELSGADLRTLARPRILRGKATLGKAWTSVAPGSDVPAAVTSAVLLDVRVSAASSSGLVKVRQSSSGGGVDAVGFRAAKAASGLVLVPLGQDGTLELRSTAGAPKVEVRLVAWATDFSSLRFPESPVGTTVRTGSSAAQTPLTGVPATAKTAVLAVTTTATAAGALKVWPAGASAPAQTLRFAAGTTTRLMTVAPGSGAKVSVLAKAGRTRTTTTVTPVAWTEQALVGGLVPRTRGTLATGRELTLDLRDDDITATADAVLLSVNAPAGVTAEIWPGTAASGAPVASATSTGSATSVWVPLPDSGKIHVRARGTKRAKAAIVTLGFSDDPGGATTTLDPKPSTRFVGAADVIDVDLAARTLTLRAQSGVAAGEHLVVTSADGGTYLVTVSDAVEQSPGVWHVSWTTAEITEVFDHFAASYDGTVPTAPALTRSVRSVRLAARQGLPFSVSFLEGENWSCEGNVATAVPLEVKPILDLSTHLDVSTSERTFDFSVKGNLGLELRFHGGQRVSCSVDADSPAMIPIPGTPLGITLGATGSASIGTNIEGTDGTAVLSGGVRFYAAAYYFDGETGGAHTGSPYLTASNNGVMPTADFRVGVRAKVGWWRPPGITLAADPYASLTTGMYLKLDRPDSQSDPLHRNLMGPRCLDLSTGPFVQVGAGVALAFLPDVSIDLPAWEPFAEVLWRGPCVGYSGTITYEVDETWDWGSCTASYCHLNSSTKQTMVKTLEPQMADFGRFYDYSGAWGAPLAQPHDWTYTENSSTRYEGSTCYGFCDGYYRCATTTTANGSGHVGWNPDNLTHAWVVDGYDYPQYARASSGVNGPVATTERTTESTALNSTGPVGSADDYCGEVGSERASEKWPDSWETSLEAPHLHFAAMPSINMTLTGHNQYHPEFTWTAELNLTRIEFQR